MVGEIVTVMDWDGVAVPKKLGKNLSKLESTIHVILCNLVHAYSVEPDIHIGFSRGKDWYPGKGVSYDYVIKITDYLHEHEYIEMTTGTVSPCPRFLHRWLGAQARVLGRDAAGVHGPVRAIDPHRLPE